MDTQIETTSDAQAAYAAATYAKASRRERILPFALFAIVILCDQLSKYLVESSLQFFEVWTPFPAYEHLFRVMHVSNTGMAFGLFPDGSLFFGLMAIVVSVAIIYYNHILPGSSFWLRVALGLTLGGALGNLIDRLRLGHVTDFLDVGPWPLFNIADMAIVGGAIILAWQVLLEMRAERRQAILDRETSDSAETNL